MDIFVSLSLPGNEEIHREFRQMTKIRFISILSFKKQYKMTTLCNILKEEIKIIIINVKNSKQKINTPKVLLMLH